MVRILEDKLAVLENAGKALVFSGGMTAASIAFLYVT